MSDSHIVTLHFRLAEEVTPDHFARRVAEACFNYGALRREETLVMPSDPSQEFHDIGPQQVRMFGIGGDPITMAHVVDLRPSGLLRISAAECKSLQRFWMNYGTLPAEYPMPRGLNR